MKLGRNDPCSCGSGKKYKHCCFAAQQQAAAAPDEIAWRRLRRALEGFPGAMLEFVLQTYGNSAVEEAWDEFLLWPEEPTPLDSQHAPVFFPWMYHRWSPDPEDTRVSDESLHGVPPTQAYLQRKGQRLDPALHRYLQACLAAPFGFYEILSCAPGRGFRVRELITAAECDVLEHSASQSMRVGDLLFGSLVACDGIVLLEACALRGIPPIHKIDVMRLRQQMPMRSDAGSPESSHDWEDEIRTLYLEIIEPLLNPSLPELRNTDGDALSLQRLIYDIDSAEAAFEALKQLALGKADAELRTHADLDPEGKLSRVSFDWRKPGNRVHQSWDNTILGNIEIDERLLTVQVNSTQRAQQFKRIVEQRLGAGARYRATEIQSIERALADSRQNGPDNMSAADPEQAALMQQPEVQVKLREMLSQYYEAWVNQSIPALDGQTPLQAVQDPDGREMVAALLAQMERNDHVAQTVDQSDMLSRLRARLGLAPAR